jgi:serine/threonine protein kinase
MVAVTTLGSAMKDVHAKGIVHRDLKPSNCILNKYDDKSIKIVDFGLARLIQAEFIPPGICACDFDRVYMYVCIYVCTYIYIHICRTGHSLRPTLATTWCSSGLTCKV